MNLQNNVGDLSMVYIYIYMSKEGSEEDWKCIKKVKMHKNPLTLDLFIPCMGREDFARGEGKFV